MSDAARKLNAIGSLYCVLAVLSIGLTIPHAWGDTVRLADGSEMRGEINQVSDSIIKI